jgi:hypothetical protein
MHIVLLQILIILNTKISFELIRTEFNNISLLEYLLLKIKYRALQFLLCVTITTILTSKKYHYVNGKGISKYVDYNEVVTITRWTVTGFHYHVFKSG